MDLSPSDWKYVDERADSSFVGREWVFARVRDFLSGLPGTFLISELLREVGGFADRHETLYKAVLRAATELETNEVGLVFAAQRSREFALALTRVIRHTTPKPGGLLATFADQTASQPDPQSAARHAIELYRKTRD
jgi:hypothetical protein